MSGLIFTDFVDFVDFADFTDFTDFADFTDVASDDTVFFIWIHNVQTGEPRLQPNQYPAKL
jgi:hypothetical protein